MLKMLFLLFGSLVKKIIMLGEIKGFFLNIKHITFSQLISFFLGLILISAIPYSAGIAKDWFIPITDGYQISFFYAIEIIIFGMGFFLVSVRFKSKTENFIFIALLGILLSRIISLVFAEKFDSAQTISLMRYVEVFLTIYVLSDLLSKKYNRIAFIAGLGIAVLFESIAGFTKFIYSGGLLRGIFTGIPAFQLSILFILALVLLVGSTKKWVLISFISILTLGIIATQTRTAFIQLGFGLIIVLFWGVKTKIVKSMVPIIFASFIIALIVSFSLKTIINTTSQRIIETADETGTLQYRLYLWDKSVGAFLSHPITGIGSGGFGRQLSDLPQVFHTQFPRSDKNKPLSSHNTVLGIMAETGMIGLMAYGIWLWSLIIVIIKIFKNKQVELFAIACAIIMCIFIFSDFWAQNSFLPNSNFILAFMLGSLRENSMEVKPV
jgi:O-antigen ligase